ncbi:MAG: hydrogenase formation protein HypD [Thermodesulfobacteriota bacterium]|nr:MAG: hydrogenase formation protein HypD [Thermodesulfobacteriota bacterium]
MKSLNSLSDLWNKFKDPQRVKKLVTLIKNEIEKYGQPINIMEFCGGHTHVILRNGLDELLKDYVNFIHGPGCPVCVIALERLDLAIELAKMPDVILCTYGDLMRVPGSNRMSLLKLRAEGYEIRSISSALEALKLAIKNPHKKVIFFAIGFETTSPHTAVLIKQAKELKIKNLWVVCNHILALVVLEYLLQSEEKPVIDAFIGPGHVSTITGSKAYEPIVKKYQTPIVISGFEPLDVIQAIYLIAKQIREGKYEVEIQYTRSVTPEGNIKAKEFLKDVFNIRKTFPWRGLGEIPNSAYEIKPEYENFDGEKVFKVSINSGKENPQCLCRRIIKGLNKPPECKLFGKACTPQNPIGPCMVSSEGACLAYFKYKKIINNTEKINFALKKNNK